MSPLKTAPWTSTDIPPQTSRRAIVTGANSGIGFPTALELARAGAEVTLACRDLTRGNEAAALIRREVPGSKVHVAALDVSSLASVRLFAEAQVERPLDLLIHNAGIMGVTKRRLSPEGYELQFATNYLGPFALTALLFPALLVADSPRVITVTSIANKSARIDFNNLQGERSYKPMSGAYGQSKLADIIFSLELQRRATASGLSLRSIAVHPGFAVTPLQTKNTGAGMKVLNFLFKPFLSQDAAHGALPTLYAAAAPAAQPGGYYGPGGLMEMKGYPAPAPIPPSALDRAVAQQLWAVSEQLTGVSFPALTAG